MRVGMLWFDDNQERTLAQRVERACLHYEAKYGVMPTLCYVHPNTFGKCPSVLMVEGNDGTKHAVNMKGTNMVLPHHYWLGRTPESEAHHDTP